MNTSRILIAVLFGSAVATAAQAQQTAVQRDVNQQERIQQGLQSGQLSTKEASQLEHEQAHVDKMESNALKNGNMSQQERNRINAAQNRVSQDISRDKHNGVVGNPNSASSQRMQADVQRNINQEQRIKQGLASGSLTNREAGRLENGQAHVDRREARAGADGHVGAREEHAIQSAENRQSGHIYHEKHDRARRG
jgi:hypothetical protein